MRSLLTVLSDESLLNRIKLILSDDKSIELYYALSGDEASAIAGKQEIAVVILDYDSPIISGPELCELLLSYNPETQFIMFFDEKDTKDVLDVYNKLHLNKLLCKQYLVLEDLPSLVEMCLHKYNRDEEIDKMDEQYKEMNDMYLHPMNEMSSILNERLIGYENVIKVFKNSLKFVVNTSDKAIKTINSFVDKIINDYIHIYMIREPQVDTYFGRINQSFNDPEGRKYFKFVCEEETIPEEFKYNLLFVLDTITIFFDSFYPYYRGKVSVSNISTGDKTELEINAIYEVRRDNEITDIYGYIKNSVVNIIKLHCVSLKHAQKNNIIQIKAVVSKTD